jgi:CRP/FNR family transcriptional regulator
LQALFRGGRKFTYAKNETILRAREAPRGVYLIESGLIKMYSLSRQKDEHVLDFFGPGELFPIIWPSRRSIRSMYYEAISSSTMWMVTREDFRGFIGGNPEVMSDVLEELIDRYHLYVGRVDNLLYSDARERSAYRLLSLASRFGVNTREGIVINALITHEDLAHSVNMTRETFGRSLARLQEKGIISYDSERHIIIKDLDALAQLVGRHEAETMWPDLIKNTTPKAK